MQFAEMVSELFVFFAGKRLVSKYQHKVTKKEFSKPCYRLLIYRLRYIDSSDFSTNTRRNGRKFNNHRQLEQKKIVN